MFAQNENKGWPRIILLDLLEISIQTIQAVFEFLASEAQSQFVLLVCGVCHLSISQK
jgi:hypothetical protein